MDFDFDLDLEGDRDVDFDFDIDFDFDFDVRDGDAVPAWDDGGEEWTGEMKEAGASRL